PSRWRRRYEYARNSLCKQFRRRRLSGAFDQHTAFTGESRLVAGREIRFVHGNLQRSKLRSLGSTDDRRSQAYSIPADPVSGVSGPFFSGWQVDLLHLGRIGPSGGLRQELYSHCLATTRLVRRHAGGPVAESAPDRSFAASTRDRLIAVRSS